MKDMKKRNAVARIMAAEDKGKAIAAEAQRLRVHSRTVERWVASVEGAIGGAGQPAVSGNAASPEKTPENPLLDTLLEKEAEHQEGASGKKDAPITDEERVEGKVNVEGFCVDALNGLKSMVGSVVVQSRFHPHLDASSSEVLKLLKFGAVAELAIRANAPRLYPILAKHSGTWGALALACAADAFGTMLALEGMARAKGWTPPEKAERKVERQVPRSVDPKPASVPSVAEYAASLQPPSLSEAAKASIIDAPLPPKELAA